MPHVCVCARTRAHTCVRAYMCLQLLWYCAFLVVLYKPLLWIDRKSVFFIQVKTLGSVSPTLLWCGQKYNLASSLSWLEDWLSIWPHTVIVLLLSSLFPFKDLSFGRKSPNKAAVSQKCNITFPPASHLLPLCNSDSMVIKQKTNVGTCRSKKCTSYYFQGEF